MGVFLMVVMFLSKSIVSVWSFRFLLFELKVAEGEGLIDTVHR